MWLQLGLMAHIFPEVENMTSINVNQLNMYVV